MKLTVKKSEHLDDWYLIERAEHDGRIWTEEVEPDMHVLRCSSRFSDADVEGHATEMLAIADAIEKRGEASFKRCAVDARCEQVTFRSPRNSEEDGVVPYADALALAAEIRRVCVTSTERARALVDAIRYVDLDYDGQREVVTAIAKALDEARADGMGEALEIAKREALADHIDWLHVDNDIAERQAALRATSKSSKP